MKVNKKRILRRLEARQRDRKGHMLYLSSALMKRFKRACGKNAPSVVIEEMIKDFLSDK